MDKILNNLLNSVDLNVLSYNLKIFCEAAENIDFDNAFYKNFHEQLTRLCKNRSNNPFFVFNGIDTIQRFILVNWSFRKAPSENLENLKQLYLSIENIFTVPKGKRITEQQIENMFALVENKFRLSNRLLHNPVDVLLVDNTCVNSNALYYVNFKNKMKDLIVLTYVNDDIVSPEFAFLHELGHMVHTRVTQKMFVSSKSFDRMHELIFRYVGTNNADAPKKWITKWFAEWFAECFAIAALHNTLYAKYDYHHKMSTADKDAICFYMEVFMSTLEHNPKGRFSWDEIFKEDGSL